VETIGSSGEHEKRGLEYVLRGVMVTDDASRCRENHRPVAIYQGRKGCLVAILGESPNEFAVRRRIRLAKPAANPIEDRCFVGGHGGLRGAADYSLVKTLRPAATHSNCRMPSFRSGLHRDATTNEEAGDSDTRSSLRISKAASLSDAAASQLIVNSLSSMNFSQTPQAANVCVCTWRSLSFFPE
jgi:hypothetical protein